MFSNSTKELVIKKTHRKHGSATRVSLRHGKEFFIYLFFWHLLGYVQIFFFSFFHHVFFWTLSLCLRGCCFCFIFKFLLPTVLGLPDRNLLNEDNEVSFFPVIKFYSSDLCVYCCSSLFLISSTRIPADAIMSACQGKSLSSADSKGSLVTGAGL